MFAFIFSGGILQSWQLHFIASGLCLGDVLPNILISVDFLCLPFYFSLQYMPPSYLIKHSMCISEFPLQIEVSTCICKFLLHASIYIPCCFYAGKDLALVILEKNARFNQIPSLQGANIVVFLPKILRSAVRWKETTSSTWYKVCLVLYLTISS